MTVLVVILGVVALTELGIIIHILPKRRKHEGVINVSTVGDKRVYRLELNGDPSELEHKEEVLFKMHILDEDA